jgi:hypothetical protein
MKNSNKGDKSDVLEIITDFVVGSNDSVFDEIGRPMNQYPCFNSCAKFPYRAPQSFKSKANGGPARFLNSILETFDRFMNQFKSFSIFNVDNCVQVSRAVMISHLQAAELPMKSKRGFSRAKCLSATLIKQGFDLFQFPMAKMLGIGKLQTQREPSMVIKGNFYQRPKRTVFENNRNPKSHFNHPYKHNIEHRDCQTSPYINSIYADDMTMGRYNGPQKLDQRLRYRI